MHRIFAVPLADVYPLYKAKLERKGRDVAGVDQAISWLTGLSQTQIHQLLDSRASFAEFFDSCTLNPAARQITGVICGVRVEEIEDPLMQKIRYLDKLIDELAKGKPIEKVLRG